MPRRGEQVTLAGLGIHLRRHDSGEHRTACPDCVRRKSRKGDDALAVKVEPEGSVTWICHRCGWKGALPAPGEPRRAPARQACPSRAPEPERSPAGLSGAAAGVWRDCRLITADSPAGRYLLKVRGCALPPPASDLRWHPRLWHPLAECTFPALVALVTDAATGRPMTLHRTWLAPDGGSKAPVDKPRLLMKGHDKAGGMVRLFPDDEVTSGLAIAEGLETALTAAAGFTPIWAALDAANLAAFPVLDGIDCLTILADHDRPNRQTGKRAGIEAAEACAKRWLDAGREVRVWRSPVEGQDFNDFAAGEAA